MKQKSSNINKRYDKFGGKCVAIGIIDSNMVMVCTVLLAFRTFYCSVLFTIHTDRFININCLKEKTRCSTIRQLIFINLSMCIVNKTEQ